MPTKVKVGSKSKEGRSNRREGALSLVAYKYKGYISVLEIIDCSLRDPHRVCSLFCTFSCMQQHPPRSCRICSHSKVKSVKFINDHCSTKESIISRYFTAHLRSRRALRTFCTAIAFWVNFTVITFFTDIVKKFIHSVFLSLRGDSGDDHKEKY